MTASQTRSENETNPSRRLFWVIEKCQRISFVDATSKTDLEQGQLLWTILLLAALKFLSKHQCLDPWTRSSETAGALDPRELTRTLGAVHETAKALLARSDLWIPDSLVADSKVVQEIWSILSSESELFHECASFGYAYQYFQRPFRKETQSKIQAANKGLSREQVIAFTQLYTPTWIVQFLLQNTVLPQVDGNLSDRIAHQYTLNRHASHQAKELDSITVLDPACGGGHFVVAAFEQLVGLHRAVGTNATDAADKALMQVFGCDIDRDAVSVSLLCLALSYSARTKQIPNFSRVQLSIVNGEILGSLCRDLHPSHLLNRKYSAVVTNPPYIGRKLMSRELKSALKSEYPDSCQDLSAPFMMRAAELLEEGGRLGFITQSSTMYLPSYASLRETLLHDCPLVSAVELGSGVFPLQTGEKVDSVMIVASKSSSQNASKSSGAMSLLVPNSSPGSNSSVPDSWECSSSTAVSSSSAGSATSRLNSSHGSSSSLSDSSAGSTSSLVSSSSAVTTSSFASSSPTAPPTFIDVSADDNKSDMLEKIIGNPSEYRESRLFERTIATLESIPFHAFQYSCPPELIEVLGQSPRLGTIADVRQGLATTDNKRFVKYSWEVDGAQIGTSWFPYVKGAGTEKWISPVTNVVNFANSGAEIKETVSAKYPYLQGKTAWVVKNEQYYFRAGLCFSFVSTAEFSARVLPAGCIFDVAASAIFAPPEMNDFLLAYLNSSFLRSICKLVNPTINMQVGDVKRLPLLTFSDEAKEELSELSRKCCNLKAALDSYCAPPFQQPNAYSLGTLLVSDSAEDVHTNLTDSIVRLQAELLSLEAKIDTTVLSECLELKKLEQSVAKRIFDWVQKQSSNSKSHAAMRLADPSQAALTALTQTIWKQFAAAEQPTSPAGEERKPGSIHEGPALVPLELSSIPGGPALIPPGLSSNPENFSPMKDKPKHGETFIVRFASNGAQQDTGETVTSIEIRISEATRKWLEQNCGTIGDTKFVLNLNKTIKQLFKKHEPFRVLELQSQQPKY